MNRENHFAVIDTQPGLDTLARGRCSASCLPVQTHATGSTAGVSAPQRLGEECVAKLRTGKGVAAVSFADAVPTRRLWQGIAAIAAACRPAAAHFPTGGGNKFHD